MNVRLIEKKYNISITKKQELFSGYVCKKWILETKTKKFLLKEMHVNELKRLEFINNVQNILASDNLTAKILYTNNNYSYFLYNNNYYVLYEYVEGHHLDKKELSFKNQYELGVFLGNIHMTLNSTNINNLEMLETKCLKFDKPNIDRIINLINFHLKNNNSEAVLILKSKLKLLENICYDDINNTFLKYNNKIVHGDFYLDNILKNDNLLCLDLDQTCIFPLQYEIYRAISMICYDDVFENLKIFQNIKNFLAGYNSIYNLSKDYLLEGLELFIYISLNSLYCLNVGDDISYAKYKFKMIEWLLQNKNNIIRIIQEVINEKTNTSFSYTIQKK